MALTTVLERGMLLRDIPAHTLDGRAVEPSDFRGRRNLVLVFPGAGGEESALISDVRRHTAELQEEEAVVLIAEPSDNLRQIYGAIAADGTRIAALYITDRYGEIYFAQHGGGSVPGVAAILEWLRFINAQCPE